MKSKMEYKTRKSHRIKWYDYGSSGAYFITVCAKERKNFFWADVGAPIGRPHDFKLSSYGLAVEQAINNIEKIYSTVIVDSYIIMPDHIHLLLIIQNDPSGRPMAAPTINQLVNQMKGYISKQFGFSIWQKSFYDHVIRNNKDYEFHIKYIYENPIKWYFHGENHDDVMLYE